MILDIFGNDAFTLQALTDAINKKPFVPRQAGQLGIFVPEPITTISVSMEEMNGQLSLISTAPRSGTAKPYEPEKRKLRSLAVPHIPYPSRINADQVQGVRQFGSGTQLETVLSVVNRHLGGMAQNHDATLEHLMVGALKGSILDADGTTEIMNLFTEFNVTQQAEVPFILGTATTNIKKICHELIRSIEDELGNFTYDHIHGFVSSTFFDDLVTHPKVEQAYERQSDGEFLRDSQARRRVTIYGITFEEYRGKVGGVDFIPTDKAQFFPVADGGLYKTFYAPANYMETVNTLGLPRYARISPDSQFNKFVDVETQSNPLPICTRPRVLVRGRKGA